MAIGTLDALDRANVKGVLFDKLPEKRAGLKNAKVLDFRDENGEGIKASALMVEPSSPTILYFPAEFDTDHTIELLAKGINECGFSFVAFEYKEFGLSSGSFSFKNLLNEADFFVSSILSWREKREDHGPIVIMGRSLGSIPAIDQALKIQDKILCLVLESAFSSTKVFLERSGVDPSLISDEPIFNNKKKMAEFKRPVLFIHSPRDVIQTLPELEWLVMESRSKATQLQIAPSGTRVELANQVGPLYMDVFKQYINLRRGIRPPRKRRRQKH